MKLKFIFMGCKDYVITIQYKIILYNHAPFFQPLGLHITFHLQMNSDFDCISITLMALGFSLY